MKLTQHIETEGNVIRAYADGEARINESVYRESLIVTPDRLITGWPVDEGAPLAAEHLAPLLELGVDIVVIGTGRRLRFPAPEVLALLGSHGIGAEVMDTAAACRTFAVLASEGRRVAAALVLG